MLILIGVAVVWLFTSALMVAACRAAASGDSGPGARSGRRRDGPGTPSGGTSSAIHAVRSRRAA